MRVLEERAEAYIGNDPASEYTWAAVGNQRRSIAARNVQKDEPTRQQYVRLYELLYADMCAASHSGQLVRRPDGTVDRIRCGYQMTDAKPIDVAGPDDERHPRGVRHRRLCRADQ